MSGPAKAVFLSYASQDAEAAKRICEILRAVGVEVWFDAEGGLEHGDEWDAKIRRQIKECVLFIPIISANTQSRHEGYFRIEWDLADERAHGIAAGVPFILPVIIDETREPDALVPDRFRKVQWTRLPGGVVSQEVQARFLKLWSHRTGVLSHEQARAIETGGSPPQKAGWSGIKTYALIAGTIAVLFAAGVWWFAGTRRAVTSGATAPTPAATPLSETQQLVAKAWELLDKPGLARAELEAAEGLCQRAAEIDKNNAEVWATWSQIDTWYVYHDFEDTQLRREAARDYAARAMQLAPESFGARLAQACYLVRCHGPYTLPPNPAEAERQLRELLAERPDEPRALFALAILVRNLKRYDDSLALFDRLAKNSAFAATAWNERAYILSYNLVKPGEAEVAADRSIAIAPFFGNLNLKIGLSLYWDGDLDAARSALLKMPTTTLAEDYGAITADQVYEYLREPDNRLRALAADPHEWFSSNFGYGPKKKWTGNAYEQAGRKDAAAVERRGALLLVDKKLAEHPDDSRLYELRAILLVDLGERDEAKKAYHLYREFSGEKSDSPDPPWLTEVTTDWDRVLRELENKANDKNSGLTAASLRLDPFYDPLRKNPRFQAMIARCESDPLRSPHAKPAAAGSSAVGQASDSKPAQETMK